MLKGLHCKLIILYTTEWNLSKNYEILRIWEELCIYYFQNMVTLYSEVSLLHVITIIITINYMQ